jgi:hypothetical protein
MAGFVLSRMLLQVTSFPAIYQNAHQIMAKTISGLKLGAFPSQIFAINHESCKASETS